MDLLRQLGAEILYFSPLHDRKLPEKLQGLLIGGGYPELYAQALSENTGMLQDIRKQIAGGLPYLAECGGFMYLHESMEDMEQKHWPMAGILSGKAFYTGKLGRFGYVELTAEQDQMLGRAGDCIRAHEFHYFDSSDNGMRQNRCAAVDGTVCRQEAAMRRDFHICIIIPTRSLH